jgi:hypothetical protein
LNPIIGSAITSPAGSTGCFHSVDINPLCTMNRCVIHTLNNMYCSMKRTTALLSLFALCALIVAGCTDNPASSSGDKKTTLTAKTWKVTVFKEDGADLVPTGLAPTAYKFNTDGTYSVTILGITAPGTWEFNVDETNIITEKGTSKEANWYIQVLNSSSMKLKATMTDSTGNHTSELEAVPQ